MSLMSCQEKKLANFDERFSFFTKNGSEKRFGIKAAKKLFQPYNFAKKIIILITKKNNFFFK